AGLQVLEDTFSAQGFEVLGFLSNDFGNQAGTMGQMDACAAKYGLTFQQFAIDHVIDTDGPGPIKAEPVFDWLEAQQNPGPAFTLQPTWNFHKYLIGRGGALVADWDTPVYPGDNPDDP